MVRFTTLFFVLDKAKSIPITIGSQTAREATRNDFIEKRCRIRSSRRSVPPPRHIDEDFFLMNSLPKGPFIFYEHGGAGGIWLFTTTKLYDPPLACNFFSHAPPQQRLFFSDDPPPPPPAEPETNHTPNFNKTLMYCLYQR